MSSAMRGTVLMPLVMMAVLVKEVLTMLSAMSSISNASGCDVVLVKEVLTRSSEMRGSLDACGLDSGIGQGSTYQVF